MGVRKKKHALFRKQIISLNIRVIATAVLLVLSVPLTALAEEGSHAAGIQAEGDIHLSAGLRDLLGQEMQAIESGMQDLVPAIAAGEWEDVASIGRKISDSFIMKQKLTAAQKEELHRTLPQLFIEMDQEFHASAGMLAHAAGMRNSDVVNFYFFKLNNACVACHAKFAKERFPGLVGNLTTE